MRVGPAAVAAALVAVLAAGAALAATFTDPLGDQIVVPEGADTTGMALPELTGVEVTNTPDGLVTFRITLANDTLPQFSATGVVLDLDKNMATGDDGIEALIDLAVGIPGLEPSELVFERWDGSELVEVPTTTVTATFTAGVLTITAPRSELLNTRGFTFGAVSLVIRESPATIVADIAPDDDQPSFVYDLVAIPPPAPPVLTMTRKGASPPQPRAGKPFTVNSSVARDDTGAAVTSGRVTCAARVGQGRIRSAGSFLRGRARCALTVPANAKGKRLRVTMTIRAAGASVATTFVFRVG